MEKIATVIQKTREAQTKLADVICKATEQELNETLDDAGGSLNDWGDATYAELAVVASARRLEEWDRAVFVATLTFNSNPYLKKAATFDNPLRENKPQYKKVTLEEAFS